MSDDNNTSGTKFKGFAMFKLKNVSCKPVQCRDPEACRLLRIRAFQENRSLENTMKLTVLEALKPKKSFRDSIIAKSPMSSQEISIEGAKP